MPDGRHTLDYYITHLEQSFKMHGIRRYVYLVGDSDLLEAYTLRGLNGKPMGEITYRGVLKLGDMNFKVESAINWERWKNANYPDTGLQEALSCEISKADLRNQISLSGVSNQGMFGRGCFSGPASDIKKLFKKLFMCHKA